MSPHLLTGRVSVPVLRPVLNLVGRLLVGLAAVMLVPAAVDAYAGVSDWQVFALSAAVTVFVGITVVLATQGDVPPLGVRQTFLMTALAWIALCFFAALPFRFAMLRLDLVDAFYEAVSGLTTTGGTVIVGLDRAPPGILLWRALLNWIGGIGIIVMALLIFPFLRIGGMQLFRSESSERSEKLFAHVQDFALAIVTVYASLTVASALLFRLAGMAWFDAVCHAMAAISTGGFSTRDASLGAFPGIGHLWVAVGSMIAGAIPLTFYARLGMQGRAALFDSQIRTFLGVLGLCVAAMSAWTLLATDLPPVLAVTHAAVNVVSIVTDTGFVSTDYGLWGSFAVTAFFLFYFIGGCTGSTSGSIKIFRWQVLFQAFQNQMRRMVVPRRVLVPTYNFRPLTDDVMEAVVNFVVLYVLSFAVLSLVLAAMGLDFLTSISSVAAALAGAGPGLGPVVGPAGTFAPLPDPAKLTLCVAMLLGRLEIFTILILFMPAFWHK